MRPSTLLLALTSTIIILTGAMPTPVKLLAARDDLPTCESLQPASMGVICGHVNPSYTYCYTIRNGKQCEPEP